MTGVQARVTTSDGRHLVATSGVTGCATGRPVPPNGRFRIASTCKSRDNMLQQRGADRPIQNALCSRV